MGKIERVERFFGKGGSDTEREILRLVYRESKSQNHVNRTNRIENMNTNVEC